MKVFGLEIGDIYDFSDKFPKWKGEGLISICQNSYWNSDSIDLLTKMLNMDPCKDQLVKKF